MLQECMTLHWINLEPKNICQIISYPELTQKIGLSSQIHRNQRNYWVSNSNNNVKDTSNQEARRSMHGVTLEIEGYSQVLQYMLSGSELVNSPS